MSNTIANYITSTANLYKADSINPELPMLSESDFLASLALDRRCGEKFNSRTIDCHKRYLDNPDQFIDNVLGNKGTAKRSCYDRFAKSLYQLAVRYFDCKDEVSYDHPYLFESRQVESAANMCR